MSNDTSGTRFGDTLDPWIWQIQTLSDLEVFVRRHGPNSTAPLPILAWTAGTTRTAVADIPAADPDPVAAITSYGEVLGAEVTVRHLPDRLVYAVKGRIGARQGTKQEPRTTLIIRATIRHQLDEQEAGK